MRKYLDVIKGLRFVRNKYDVLLHLAGLHRKDVITYHLKNGLQLLVPNQRKNRTTILSIKEIFVDEIYPVADDGAAIVIDIGAQSGIFSLYAALRNPGAVIYSFEPDPGNFDQLRTNIHANNLAHRILIFNVALSGKGGPMTFFINENSSRAHSLFGSDVGQRQVVVQGITLDDVFKENHISKCDSIKIDIEGAEYDVLFNSTSETLSRINRLMLECHLLHGKGDLFDITAMAKFLADKDFQIVYRKKDIIWAQRG